MKHYRSILVLASLALLSACGSATDSITFKAPSTFTSKASLGPFMQIWESRDTKSVLTVVALPTKVDLNEAFSQSEIKDADVKSKEHVTICGNQPAIFADVIGTAGAALSGGSGSEKNAKSERGRVEFLATNVGNKTYMAMYMRPLDAPPDRAAESAIRNLCAK